MTNAANFNDYSGDGVFGRDRRVRGSARKDIPRKKYPLQAAIRKRVDWVQAGPEKQPQYESRRPRRQ
jgi:hypothetical protein